MEQPDAGVCRTCLSPKTQLIEMQQAVPNLELMTYSDILDFCTNLNTPDGQRRRQLTTKYPLHICLRCSKALEVSYHFLKMVRSTDAILQGQQQDANDLRRELAKKYETQKKDTPTPLKVAVVIANQEVLLQEQKLAVDQKQQNRNMPTALVSGAQKDRTMEESQMFKPFTSNESPSKVLWDNNGIKSDLCSIAELKDFDWMDGEYFGLGDNFANVDDEKNTKIIKTETKDDFLSTISQDQYFTDSEAVECAVKTEVFNPNEQTVNLPKIVLATQMNVPYENQLTEDFLLKNSITKAVENAKSVGIMMLNDFVDDLKENDIYDDNQINSVEEASYGSDDSKLLMKTMKHLVCGLCNETFTDMKEYSRHVNRHKGIIPVRCKQCNFYSCYPESMRKHYKKIHCLEPTNKMLTCPINPQKPAQELKYHEKTYQCSKCTKESHNRRDIKLHLLSTHHVLNNTDALILSNYNCPECLRSFKHQSGMRLHFIRAHGKRKEEPLAPGETFQCQTCAKVFPLKRSLSMHQRICEGPTNIYCNLCNKSHDSVRQFEQHLCKEHDIEMIHECDICGKTFRNANYMSAHRKRHMERNFQCQQCPKKYIKKSELQVHIDRKHNTETKALCVVCGLAFTSVIDLSAHETKEHHFKKLHNCSHCSYKTTTVSRLKLHQYTHVGMPYRCTTCDKGFALRLLMRHHSLTAHQITLNDIDLANMFRQNMGYPSRYDVFSNNEYTLDLPEIVEEDIQQELSEFGLNFDDIMRDLFDEKKLNENDENCS